MSPTLDRRRAIVSLAGIGAAGVVSTRSVTAQGTPAVDMISGQGPTIVVTATGSASTPATHAIAQLIIRGQYGPVPLEEEPGISPPAAPEVSADDVAAVVAALVEEGLDESMILSTSTDSGLGGGYFGPGSAVIVFQLDNEQIKTLPNLLEIATKKVTDLALMFDQPGAMYLSDACEEVRAAAFQDTVEKGTEEASLLADAMGVAIAGLSQARKQTVAYGPPDVGYTASDDCDDLIDLGTAVRSYLPPYDATLPIEFVIYAVVEFTFTTM